jgi:predicted transcriptional regulator
MKLIKTTLLTTTLTLLSANALANQFVDTTGNLEERFGTRTLHTAVVESKQEAYQLGLAKLSELATISPSKLRYVLSAVNAEYGPDRIHLNEDGNVTVQEFMNADGQVLYKGQINVTYHYSERDTDH